MFSFDEGTFSGQDYKKVQCLIHLESAHSWNGMQTPYVNTTKTFSSRQWIDHLLTCYIVIGSLSRVNAYLGKTYVTARNKYVFGIFIFAWAHPCLTDVSLVVLFSSAIIFIVLVVFVTSIRTCVNDVVEYYAYTKWSFKLLLRLA